MSIESSKESWSQSFTFGSRTIYAFERPDRSGAIYVKFVDDALAGRGAAFRMHAENLLMSWPPPLPPPARSCNRHR
jgi:hypothetical protein